MSCRRTEATQQNKQLQEVGSGGLGRISEVLASSPFLVPPRPTLRHLEHPPIQGPGRPRAQLRKAEEKDLPGLPTKGTPGLQEQESQ